MKCSRCKEVFYCSKDHQKANWKTHKKACGDAYKADQLSLHKQEFDRIIKKYKLDTEENSEKIASLLTSGQTITAAQFSETFGTTNEEAVVFLEWIKVGVKFKEESIDVAKKSGLGR